ncbi:MAG: tRNA pseudouridine(38-40) synthase TruA [Candidatus Undinarchaeales archaeon]|jgi:tRNA pseudouridine38-40 synthase|nr:tRNA pseudouridine(38-40) synthase TruA [Candidatus Undinarchaeales archaeon]MDP7491565.1 tRNA pseudouridine(38-40) synthase TruA [Candidatus Undinarchaeales archaeon]
MIALKLFYNGEGFHGSQVQPEVRTVAGELERALASLGATQRVRLASRTDRGVSALEQVACFEPPSEGFHPGALNDRLPDDIWVWSWADVDESFRPRHATGKEYVYVHPARLDADAALKAATMLKGEHDFTNLSRHDDRSTLRTLDTVDVTTGDCTVFTFRASSFLHEMVRRCVTLLARVGGGEAGIDAVARALDPDATVNIPPADPRWLYLSRIWYRDEPVWRDFGPGREAVRRFVRRMAEEARARQGLAGLVLSRLD